MELSASDYIIGKKCTWLTIDYDRFSEMNLCITSKLNHLTMVLNRFEINGISFTLSKEAAERIKFDFKHISSNEEARNLWGTYLDLRNKVVHQFKQSAGILGALLRSKFKIGDEVYYIKNITEVHKDRIRAINVKSPFDVEYIMTFTSLSFTDKDLYDSYEEVLKQCLNL